MDLVNVMIMHFVDLLVEVLMQDGADEEEKKQDFGGSGDREHVDTGRTGQDVRQRAPGFYRHGRWVGRPRTDEEQRFHDGGQGTKRQEKRRERARQWARGEFVPAWKKAMSTSGASSSTQVDWAGMLKPSPCSNAHPFYT